MVKKAKNSTQDRKPSNERTSWTDEYKHLFFMKTVPVNVAFLEALAKEFLEWCIKCDGALKPRRFFRDKGISFTSVCDWRKKYPWFDTMYLAGLDAIGDRREDGALDNKKNASIVMKTMHLYDPDWESVNTYWAKLNKDEDKTNGHIFNITVPAVESSPLVPEKK